MALNLNDLAQRFMDFSADYAHHFTRQGMNSVGHARHYLAGILGTQRRKNIETIGNDVQGSDYQGLEQFIGTSPWSHEAVLEQVARDADGLLGGAPDSAFYIDETSFLKKGQNSVGVKRQYSGRAGKIDNCQVAVFGVLGCGQRVCLADMRLFLPGDWAEDEERLIKAGVPLEHRVHKTKQLLALEMIRAARARGQRFQWTGFDAAYGGSHEFTNMLDDAGESFMGDISARHNVWTAPPQPSETGKSGRRHKLEQTAESELVSVEELTSWCFAQESQQLTYRCGTKGPLHVQAWVKRIWLQADDWPEARERWLVVSQDADGDFKYSLSNCMDITSLQRLVYMQRQRFWVEHAFHEAKSQLGMAQYQVRGWRAWHHHMALVCLAMLFTVREQMLQAETIPLLSLRDLTELLDHYLPRNRHDQTLLLTQITKRHAQRQRDLHRRANLPPSNTQPRHITK